MCIQFHKIMCVCVYICIEICPDTTAVQAEILNQHNAFRRAVMPTARDMLKMVHFHDSYTFHQYQNLTINVSNIVSP